MMQPKLSATGRKIAYFMMILGGLSVSSIITSIALGVFMAYIQAIIPAYLYVFALTFAVNISTFLLNNYFNKRLKEHGEIE